MAARRARDVHGLVGREAAVIGRILDDLPLAVDLLQLGGRQTLGSLALVDVIVGDILPIGIVAPDDASIGVFVVDDQDVTAVLVREHGHAVIVVAKGAGLARSRAACRMVEFRNIGKQRIAPAAGDMRVIAFRHDDRVIGAGGEPH